MHYASTCYNRGMSRKSDKVEDCLAESRSPCAISNVLDIFGDKWTLLLVRDLIFYGKHEYKEFLASPEGIATNILSNRLKRLQAAGVVNEISHPENRSRKLYYLTKKGKSLLPILREMLVWGEKYLPEKTEVMKPIFERLKKDEKGFVKEILGRLRKWEKEYLPD